MDNMTQLSLGHSSCFKNIYCQLYSSNGTSHAERIVSDITKILLCKLIVEQNNIQDISGLSGKELLRMLKEKYPQSCEQYDDFSLSDGDVAAVSGTLSNISLLDAPSHTIRDAFQTIIGPRIRGDKEQFFTPKELVECMVCIVNS